MLPSWNVLCKDFEGWWNRLDIGEVRISILVNT